jgi:AcrR family transcriptional regulator
MASTSEERHEEEQREDHGDDPEHLDPPRRASAVGVTAGILVHAASLRYRLSSSRRDVLNTVIVYTSVVPKLWNDTIETHRREVREAILETTATLVADHGLRSVTMSQIAESTGIGRATLYKYFPDIEAILFAWHERQIAGHLEHLGEVRARAGDPAERLAAVLEAYALISHESHGHHNSELAAFLHRDERVARAQHHVRHMFRDLLSEAAVTGYVRDDVAADELANYCLHALTAASTLPSKAAVHRLVTVTLAALRPSP